MYRRKYDFAFESLVLVIALILGGVVGPCTIYIHDKVGQWNNHY